MIEEESVNKNTLIFNFKQFQVSQRNCAMKINTDGVLLGAIATHPVPHNILDIGTGTGVIAMMLAQRFPLSYIDAVEIDAPATETAKDNFLNSPFAHRLQAFNTAFENFETERKYDMIVANPPFFVNDLKNPEPRKGIARHTDIDFFNYLMEESAELLNDEGVLWLVLPPERADFLIEMAPSVNLSPCVMINMHSFRDKAMFRNIICLKKGDYTLEESALVIYDEPKVHSVHYNTLLKDFLLEL